MHAPWLLPCFPIPACKIHHHYLRPPLFRREPPHRVIDQLPYRIIFYRPYHKSIDHTRPPADTQTAVARPSEDPSRQPTQRRGGRRQTTFLTSSCTPPFNNSRIHRYRYLHPTLNPWPQGFPPMSSATPWHRSPGSCMLYTTSVMCRLTRNSKKC